MSRCRWVGVVGLALCAGGVTAGTVPQPFSASYQGQQSVLLMPATARAQIALRRSARHLIYTMDSRLRWALLDRRFHDCAVLELAGDRLRPLEYRHVDGAAPENDVHLRYDWGQGRASARVGAVLRELAIEWPTWDPMSYQVALMGLAADRPTGTRERHRVIERGAAVAHEVELVGPSPDGSGPYEIVSRKRKGRVVLKLAPDGRPVAFEIDEVTIALAEPGPAPPPLVEGQVPECGTGAAR